MFNLSRRRLALAATPLILLLVGTGVSQQRSQRGIFGAGQPGEAGIVRMEAKKMGLKNFEMQSRQVDGRLAIDGFTANLGSGVMQGRGLVDWSRPNDVQQMNISFSNVPAMDLLRAFQVKLDAQIIATAQGSVDVKWAGVRGSTPRQTMNGTVRIILGPGYITNADVLNQAAVVTGIDAVRRMDFQQAELAGSIRDGVMSITTANVNGQYQRAVGQGYLDLRTEIVGLKFDAFLSPQLTQMSTFPEIRVAGVAAGKLSKSADGLLKLPIPVAMTGAVRNPQFQFGSMFQEQ